MRLRSIIPREMSFMVKRDFSDRAVLMKPPGVSQQIEKESSGWDVYDECVEGQQLCAFARQARC